MDVAVDEAGQERAAVQVDSVGGVAGARAMPVIAGRRDLHDSFAFDQDIGEARLDGRVTVDHERIREDEHSSLRSS